MGSIPIASTSLRFNFVETTSLTDVALAKTVGCAMSFAKAMCSKANLKSIKKEFLMKNRINQICMPVFLLITLSSHAATPEHRGVLDFLLNAADYAYHVQYDEYVTGTEYLLGSIINETTSFSRLFSPIH